MPSRPTRATLIADLRQLANRWTLKARDHAREAKARTTSGDVANSNYYRGVAETYYRLALELADLVRSLDEPPAPPAVDPNAVTEPIRVQSAVAYAVISVAEAASVLDYAGISARDVTRHQDNVFTAVFSRWQPLSETERLDKIRRADPRILILGSGKLRDTGDPYVEFAFRA